MADTQAFEAWWDGRGLPDNLKAAFFMVWQAALASRPAEVDDEGRTGCKLVPLEPTPEMIEAFSAQLEGACGSYFDWNRGGDEGYRAMIDAAPSHTANKEAKD